jgi:hypothetical protein
MSLPPTASHRLAAHGFNSVLWILDPVVSCRTSVSTCASSVYGQLPSRSNEAVTLSRPKAMRRNRSHAWCLRQFENNDLVQDKGTITIIHYRDFILAKS